MRVNFPKRRERKLIIRNRDEDIINSLRVKAGAKVVIRNLTNDDHCVGNNMNIKIIGKGQFLGEEDLIHHTDHTATVTCKSMKGILLKISAGVSTNIYI